MFERYTDAARRAMVLAQEEARSLKHPYIGTEHLLLGLLSDEGAANQALANMGVGLTKTRDRVLEIIGQGEKEPVGHIPFTPRAKKVMELSLREALQLGHNYIGTEHLLLGILREGDGVAAQILAREGVDLARSRGVVLKVAGSDPGSAEVARKPIWRPSNCLHPDEALSVRRLAIGIRTVRCNLCGRLVATLPYA